MSKKGPLLMLQLKVTDIPTRKLPKFREIVIKKITKLCLLKVSGS